MVTLLAALSGLAILVGVGLLASVYAAGWAWWKKWRAHRLREQAPFADMEILGTWGSRVYDNNTQAGIRHYIYWEGSASWMPQCGVCGTELPVAASPSDTWCRCQSCGEVVFLPVEDPRD